MSEPNVEVSKDLQYLLKEKVAIDYGARDGKFEVPRDEWKKIVKNIQIDGKDLTRNSQRRVFVTGVVFANILNEAGYNKWLPDRIKDTGIKLLLMKLVDDPNFIKIMEELQ